jgi:hypothetical protein
MLRRVSERIRKAGERQRRRGGLALEDEVDAVLEEQRLQRRVAGLRLHCVPAQLPPQHVRKQ